MALNTFEKSCLESFRSGWQPESRHNKDIQYWLGFGLWSLWQIGQIIRTHRISPAEVSHKLKKDSTPVSALDERIEQFFIESVHRLSPEIVIVGEEFGGELSKSGMSIAIDPLDGTWSFLSHSETCSTSLAFFQDGQPFLGMVMNPATGEIGYCLEKKTPRLLQISLFGEGDEAVDLPTKVHSTNSDCLVNVHPSKQGGRLLQKLYDAWKSGEIRLVKSSGGSPAWALLEAAKGHYSYINLWPGRPAMSYDLAAGIMLVRGAGGDVVNAEGKSISVIDHQGPFIASISQECSQGLIKQLAQILCE